LPPTIILITQIAEKEVARKEELGKTLEYMYQRLEQLDILDSLPDDLGDSLESVINRALDVRSASMLYLAVNIRHEVTPLGSIGRMSSDVMINRFI
jgi:hypothetical protein